MGSRLTAVRADAGDLDHRSLGREAGGARGGLELVGDRGRRRLADLAALVAQQEHDKILAAVMADTGDEGVSAFDPVHEPVVAKKIQRAIDRDRRRPRSAARSAALDDLVGAKRLVAFEQNLQHPAADRRQPLRTLRAMAFRVMKRIGRAAAVVMSRCVEDRL